MPSLLQLRHQRLEQRRDAPQLGAVRGGQFRQDRLARFGQGEARAALVARIVAPRHLTRTDQPVDQADRAVVPDGKTLGEVADGGRTVG
jgi:hypothetical protein